jgi:hypothetical protein
MEIVHAFAKQTMIVVDVLHKVTKKHLALPFLCVMPLKQSVKMQEVDLHVTTVK